VRLIDLIAQTREPLVVQRGTPPQAFRLRGTVDLAASVIASPARYILTDEVTKTCVELAFSCGDRLADCIDLVRVPASALWVEWSNSAALAGAGDFFEADAAPSAPSDMRVGLFLQSAPSGQVALANAFWSASNEAIACPVDAALNFRDEHGSAPSAGDAQLDDWITVTDPISAVGRLLNCARFRFETSWAKYYETAIQSSDDKERVLKGSLGTIARNIPILIAFLLLLASREGVTLQLVSRDLLNRKRKRNGRAPLISHQEVSLALNQKLIAQYHGNAVESGRVAPRRHHVQGHLVRRHNRIFWRRPHIRGTAFRGSVLSRTVTLEIRKPSEAASNAGHSTMTRSGNAEP
jgi:hypothetical protein